MKKTALSLLLAIFCMIAIAQPGNNNNPQLPQGTIQPKSHWQPQGHQFTSNQNITLMIVSPNNERFWLYINDQLYTRQSTFIAKVNLGANLIYNIKIMMDNRSRNTVSESICIGGNSNDIILTVEKSQGYGYFAGQYYHLLWNGQKINPGFGNYAYIWTYRNDPRGIRFSGGMDFYPISVTATPTATPTQPPMPPAMMPCSSHDFQNIKNIVRTQKFDSDRMNVAKQAVRGKRLTAEQIAELAELFSFESDRVKFLKYAYNECFDKSNYYVVYRVLTFSSSKDELSKYVQTH